MLFSNTIEAYRDINLNRVTIHLKYFCKYVNAYPVEIYRLLITGTASATGTSSFAVLGPIKINKFNFIVNELNYSFVFFKL